MDTNDLLNLFLKGCKNKNKKSFEWICLLLKQLEFTVLNVSQVNKEEAIILCLAFAGTTTSGQISRH